MVGENQDSDKPDQEVKRGGTLSGGLSLILALIALTATGYLWYLLYQQEGLLKSNIVATVGQLSSDTKALRENVDTLNQATQSLTEKQNTLIDALDKVGRDLGRDRSDWMLAETEQLLRIANHRLHLARDIDSALVALQAADHQLQRIANPRYLGVRKIIAREIKSLQALERADIPGIALRLGTMAENVNRLPLITQPSPETPKNDKDTKDIKEKSRGFWGVFKRMWQDLLGLVRIRNNTEPYKVLLPPKEHYFLRQNLRLMLYAAQQALLQGNTAVYQQNISSASKWIKSYFDTRSQLVTTIQDELDVLLGKNIVVALPDISGSLEALRKLGRRTPGK